MRKSIRVTFFYAITIILVVGMLGMGLVQAWLGAQTFQKDKEQSLQHVVYTVADGVHTGQIETAGDKMRTLDYMGRVADATIFMTDAKGVIVFFTRQGDMKLFSQEVSPVILEQILKQKTYKETGNLGGLLPKKHYTASAPLYDVNNELVGYIFASADVSIMTSYLKDMSSSFLLAAALVLLVSGVLTFFLSERMVVPIKKVSAAAQQFGEGNYAARVPIEGDNELAQLAVTFNEMANSIEATDMSRRSFMGNIAHELRTPMTTIKGFIDGMLDGTIPENQRDKYLNIVSEEVGRLARLTKNMLDISRLESGEYQPNLKTFDVWKTITSVFLGAQQRLEERNITVKGIEESQPIWVLADEDFTHQVLFNLIDNAIKFSEESGNIEVSVKTSRNFATIGILNTGEGIETTDINQIFDRFYKGDKSRGLNVGGSGLGLHICKVLVNLMGGRIWAESVKGSHTVLYFTLPIAPAPRRQPQWKTDIKK